jgi:hypothetical protein
MADATFAPNFPRVCERLARLIGSLAQQGLPRADGKSLLNSLFNHAENLN